LEEFSANEENAALIATSFLGPAPGYAIDELAAWTVVCNAIMNLDEFLTKR
jgi:hypothetical protein